MNRVLAGIIVVFMLLFPITTMITNAQVQVQYMPLSSYDFLTADEIKSFDNITALGTHINSSLTTITVSGGILTINNTDDKDVFFVMKSKVSYAEIYFAGDGGVAVLDASYYNESKVYGIMVVKTSTGYTVYTVNGTSKTGVASSSSTATKLMVTVNNGVTRIDLGDGIGLYETSIDGVLALAVPAGSVAKYDKLVVYTKYLAAQQIIDLGSKTIEKKKHITSFNYDLSGYSNIRSVKVVVEYKSADPYMRWTNIYLYSDNKWYSVGTEKYIDRTADGKTVERRWPNPIPSDINDRVYTIILRSGKYTADVTEFMQNHRKGTLYVCIETDYTSYNVHVKLIIDGDPVGNNNGDNNGIMDKVEDKISTNSDTLKYLAIGAGAIIIILLLFMLVSGGSKHRRGRGMAPVLAVFLILLILGGITALILAWLHPEYLTSLAIGLGAIALIALLLLLQAGKRIPNPIKPG